MAVAYSWERDVPEILYDLHAVEKIHLKGDTTSFTKIVS